MENHDGEPEAQAPFRLVMTFQEGDADVWHVLVLPLGRRDIAGRVWLEKNGYVLDDWVGESHYYRPDSSGHPVGLSGSEAEGALRELAEARHGRALWLRFRLEPLGIQPLEDDLTVGA